MGGVNGPSMMMSGFPPAFPNMQGNIQGQGNMRPGDWKCHACGNINYQSRDVCNNKNCGIPKSTYIAKTGLRPGDWICPTCQNHNYSSNKDCKKCYTPKGKATVSTLNMKPGDWLCPSCGNHNYKDKLACNRCGHTGRPT